MAALAQGHDRTPAGARDGGSARIEVQGGAADLARMRRTRLASLRRELAAQDIPCCVLSDPVNLRYACGARNMQVFMARNPARYLFVAVEGPVILFEFEGCQHLARGLDTIDEIRPAVTASFVAAGPRLAAAETAWAREIADLVTRHGAGDRRVGIERINAGAVLALVREGLVPCDAQTAVEQARAVKCADEIACIRESIAAVEEGVAALEAAIEPGRTENELWAVLHERVIARGGDYLETRLLTSGPRTNPWYQESSARPVRGGELIALDTDVVGCHGYYCDFSRTFLCGDRPPSDAQRRLYRLAREQLEFNLEVLRPGMTFREFGEGAWKIPAPYLENRYYLLAHGVGMTGEYPYITHAVDFAAKGYDGVIVPGMTLCLESYIGAENGAEGVKLEQQVLVTGQGVAPLTSYPFDERLLGREL